MIPCPLCLGTETEIFVRRNGVPVHQNLVLDNPEAARWVARGDLEMTFCRTCGFVYNGAFDPALLSYGGHYDNTQTCSPHFDAYLDTLVHRIVIERGIARGTVAEVGCGKGQFLRKLVDHPASRLGGLGYDPSYVGPDTDRDGRIAFVRQFYGPMEATSTVDAVVCRHVIEHVPDPLALLHSVHQALEKAPQAQVFFETPCVEWILDRQVIWDLFYEHCSLFSARTLAFAFERAGFRVLDVRHVFGGQYLWLEAVPARDTEPTPPPSQRLADLAGAYGAAESARLVHWTQVLRGLRRRGRVALWGAGAKGVTFANLVDPEGKLIDCLIDINPNKQGGFAPGCAHPILGVPALAARGIATAVLMNPNYRNENLRLLANAGLALSLVDLDDHP